MFSFLKFISQFSVFLILFIIVSIGLLVFFKFKVKNIKFNTKIRVFGLLLELNNRQILALSTIIIKYLYILSVIICLDQIDYIFFVIYFVLTLVFLLAMSNIRLVFLEVINCFFVYYLFKVIMLVYSYMLEIRFEWYLSFIVVISIIFMILYNTYFFVKNLNNIVTRDKYIKKEEDANVVKKI